MAKEIPKFLGDAIVDAFMADNLSEVKYLGGPVGTGKSVACLFEMINFCLRVVPMEQDGTPGKAKILVVRQDQSKIKTTVLQTFRAWFGDVTDDLTKMAYPIVVNDVPFKGTVDGEDRTVLITWIFLGVATKDEAETKLRSFEATCAYINETQTYDQPWIINETFQRLGRYPMPKRDENGNALSTGYLGQKLIVADFNPPSNDHWLYKADKEDAKPDSWKFYKYPSPLLYIKNVDGDIVDFEPNPAAADFAKKQASGYDYWYSQAKALLRQPGGLRKIAVDIMGEYGASYAGKPVYEEWDDELHIAKTKLVAVRSKPLIIGFDHSGVNPAMVIGQVGNGSYNILHELYAGEMTVEDFIDEVFTHLINLHGYERKNITIVLDPHDARDRSGQTTKRMLIKKGFKAVHARTNDPVKRQAVVKHFLTRRLLKVDKECKMLIEGFRGRYNREKIRGTELYKAVPDANKNEYSHCFVGETLVTMFDGSAKRIDDIEVGDFVLTPNGSKKVSDKMFRDYDGNLLSITTTSGASIKCTPNHKIYSDGNFVIADYLQYNSDLLEASCSKSSMESRSQNTTGQNTTKAMLILTEHLEGSMHTNTFGGYSMVENYPTIRYTFITKMATLQTMIFQTWKKLTKYLMLDNTQKNELQNKYGKVSCIWSELEQKHPSGTDQKKEELGTQHMQKKSLSLLGLIKELKTSAAYAIVFILYLRRKLKGLFVHRHVSLKQEDCQELTTNSDTAKCAEVNLLAANTQNKISARSFVLQKTQLISKEVVQCQGKIKVFDLSIDEDHVYFANGILVHNCQDATQYLLDFLQNGSGLERDAKDNRNIQQDRNRGQFSGMVI